MKRLTENYEEYISQFPKELRGNRKRYSMKSDIIYEKLGAYEDLEERLQKIYGNCDGLLEKVVEELEQHEGIDFSSPAFKSILLTNGEVERWEEIKRLEQQKKLLKLPCAVGDDVWYISERVEKQGRKKVEISFVDHGVVDNITLGHMMIPQITVCNGENVWTTFDGVEDFGKTVFLTREEAETALKELENRD